MRTRLKVCCIASVDEARRAAAIGADALGLVGPMPSGPGPIDDTLIPVIADAVAPPVATFLLTSRTDPMAVVQHARDARTTAVQLVDAVPADTYAALRAALPALKIVQVLHVEDSGVIEQARTLEPHVDAFLLDSGRPSAPVKELGGTGRVHDWELSARVVAAVSRPVFLAGGIRPDNVALAIRAVRPFGIDLCTGVRTGGKLDDAKLAELCRQIRTADAQLAP